MFSRVGALLLAIHTCDLNHSVKEDSGVVGGGKDISIEGLP